MQVVGVIKKTGKSLINIFNYDNIVLISFELARAVVNVRPNTLFGGNLQIKAADGVSEQQLKDDIVVNLRKAHYLKPREGDDFSMNSMTMFAEQLNALFTALNIAGYVIGGFALLVGIFSVANIMFVSVKERTNIIGIKKALGAKPWVILLEFLIESVILCLLGGLRLIFRLDIAQRINRRQCFRDVRFARQHDFDAPFSRRCGCAFGLHSGVASVEDGSRGGDSGLNLMAHGLDGFFLISF